VKTIAALLGSYGLAVTVVLLLFLLTLLGTLEQTESGLFLVQKKYFESLFLIHWIGGTVPLPLPGVSLLLAVLFVNLVVGGIVRMRKRADTIGVLIIHVGILLLLAAGFVKFEFSSDGQLTLFEHQASDEFQSTNEWEIAIYDATQAESVPELIIPASDFADLTGAETRTFENGDLPFRITLSRFEPNCTVLRQGTGGTAGSPAIDGFVLGRSAPEKEAERNVAGICAKLALTDGSASCEGILWGMERYPFVAGQRWAVDLRHKRYRMPFTIVLDRFTRELHPRTAMAKVFLSEVTKIENGVSEQRRIEMNEPLRQDGLVLFQASWGPDGGKPGELFSTLAVVRNPSDQWPLVACIVITIGMTVTFVQKLAGYMRAQASRRLP
jgi:hypothetical protein